MKEKDRYELQEVFEDGSFHWCLKDNDTKLLKPLVSLHNCVDLLNQQAQRIKELEETLKKARQREVIIHQNYRQGYIKDLEAINELQEENQQLNEHIKELELLLNADEKMKAYYETSIYDRPEAHTKVRVLFSRLDTILEEYQK